MTNKKLLDQVDHGLSNELQMQCVCYR